MLIVFNVCNFIILGTVWICTFPLIFKVKIGNKHVQILFD